MLQGGGGFGRGGRGDEYTQTISNYSIRRMSGATKSMEGVYRYIENVYLRRLTNNHHHHPPEDIANVSFIQISHFIPFLCLHYFRSRRKSFRLRNANRTNEKDDCQTYHSWCDELRAICHVGCCRRHRFVARVCTMCVFWWGARV